jgi:NADH-quinone oxidoreductase subunit H
MVFILITILKILSIVIPLLISVAYFTIAERKIMGAIQRRRGPNVVGFIGLLQPLADGLKLFTKETTLPTSANIGIFLFAPALAFILSLIGWSVIPFSEGIVVCDLNLGVLYLFAISSLNVYGKCPIEKEYCEYITVSLPNQLC